MNINKLLNIYLLLLLVFVACFKLSFFGHIIRNDGCEQVKCDHLVATSQNGWLEAWKQSCVTRGIALDGEIGARRCLGIPD